MQSKYLKCTFRFKVGCIVETQKRKDRYKYSKRSKNRFADASTFGFALWL